MVELLDAWEHRHRRHIDFVLQVGDFEPHRHEDDLATASLPQKYRDLGDFWAFDQGLASFEWPIYFIGGNIRGTRRRLDRGARVKRDWLTSSARRSAPTCARTM
ncbi:hypothetical protein WMF45_42230 [Sorangium sp. So ce448]|uniref:hypothetical protein n=1 Tax=Sorangium sp. So ce448 TaxID=3133314 RepID=UPI003F5EC791